MRRFQNDRRGTALVATLVCLTVVSTMMLSAVHTSIRTRRQLRNEHQIEQVRWLLDAGLRKGITELEQNPNYEGESLTLEPTLQKFSVASVNIVVARNPENESKNEVKLRVDVRIGNDSQIQSGMKRSGELSIQISR